MSVIGTIGGITDVEIVELDGLFDVVITSPVNGQVVTYQDGLFINAFVSGGGGGGSGTVTSVSVVSANGVSGSVATATTTPAITLTLGDITPSSVASTGDISTSKNGASGDPPLILSGSIFTGGGTTNTLPQVFVQPSGATPATSWSNNGTAYGVNAASGFNGNFLDFHINGGASLFSIASTGNLVSSGQIQAGTNVFAASGGLVGWTSRTRMQSPSDGVLEISNAAVNDFNRLQLGGTTSSFPAIKRSSAAIAFRLADDSADAAITTAGIAASGNITAATNDGAALGTTALQFSDIFLAEGGVINWDNGDATLTQVGDVVTLAGADLKITTAGNASTSVLTTDAAQAVTNKRITKRVTTTNAPGATPSTDIDSVDIQEFTGLNTAITSMTTNLSGTPTNGQLMQFSFVDDGTARGITWGASFANGGLVNLPTTTVISTVLRVLVQYQTIAALNKWVCVAVA